MDRVYCVQLFLCNNAFYEFCLYQTFRLKLDKEQIVLLFGNFYEICELGWLIIKGGAHDVIRRKEYSGEIVYEWSQSRSRFGD
jgi:hypothetical protein